jgi:nucleoside-diphosphate-sugar epimerase
VIKVLVVGGTGFLGSATARALSNKQYDVVIASREVRQKSEWASGLTMIEWNAENDWMLEDTKFDVILHFAGPNDDFSPVNTPQSASRTTQSVLNLWRRSGGSVLYVSTFQVFGRWAGQVQPTDEPNPTSVYGQLHLQNENLLMREFAGLPRGLLIVRPTNIVGQSANPISTKWHRVPAEFCLQAASGGPIRILSDSRTQRDFLSITTFANRIASLVEQHRQWDGRAVTIGSGKSYSLLQIARLVRELAKETLSQHVQIVESSSDSSVELLQVQSDRWNGIELVGESKLDLQADIKSLLLLARLFVSQRNVRVKTLTKEENPELA